MKKLFARYDREDNLLGVGYSWKDFGLSFAMFGYERYRSKNNRIFAIPLEP